MGAALNSPRPQAALLSLLVDGDAVLSSSPGGVPAASVGSHHCAFRFVECVVRWLQWEPSAPTANEQREAGSCTPTTRSQVDMHPPYFMHQEGMFGARSKQCAQPKHLCVAGAIPVLREPQHSFRSISRSSRATSTAFLERRLTDFPPEAPPR